MNNFKNHPLYGIHTLDTAMNALWTFYSKNFLKLFAISLVMSGILSSIVAFADLASIQNETDITVLMEKMRTVALPVMIAALVQMLFLLVMHHYILFSPIDADNSILDSVLRSLRYFFPYLVTAILLWIVGVPVMILGLVVLFVGMFFVMFYVVTLFMFILPVMMVEDTDIGQTIRRIFTLTHKRFWSNYGWVVVFFILMMIISFILSGVALLPFAGNFLKSIFNPAEAMNMLEIMQQPEYIIVSAIINALTVPLMPLFAAILYFNGKAREDAEQSNISDIERRVTVEDLYARPRLDDTENNPYGQ